MEHHQRSFAAGSLCLNQRTVTLRNCQQGDAASPYAVAAGASVAG